MSRPATALLQQRPTWGWQKLIGAGMALVAFAGGLTAGYGPNQTRILVGVLTFVVLLVLVVIDWARGLRRFSGKLAGVSVGVVLVLGISAGIGLEVIQPGGVPEPDAQTYVPAGFTVQRIEKISLDAGPIPQRVIASLGPELMGGPTPTPYVQQRAADLQVLEWDLSVRKWRVAFDAAKEEPKASYGRILPSTGVDTVIQFFEARLDVSPGNQLIFETKVLGGDAVLYGVGVIDHLRGGTKLVDWRVYPDAADIQPVGQAQAQRLQITSKWTTAAHPRADGPLRDYQLELRYPDGKIQVYADDRPFLGVQLGDPSSRDLAPSSNIIASVWPGSAAEGVCQPGDVLIDIDGQPNQPTSGGTAIPDALDTHKAGDLVTVHFTRAGVERSVRVKLASLLAVEDRPTKNWYGKYW